MKRFWFFLFFCLTLLGVQAKEKDVPRIVNFINFIREMEPRDKNITPDVLYETVKSEAEALHRYDFKGTWLLQYDALIDKRYQALMKEEMAHGCEVGGWWEITQPHVEAAGYKWRGRYPWDWHADKGFSIGYTPKQRERLVDVYMRKFREIFGKYPHSVGSWFIDAHTLAYMHDKYGVEASCNCKDQKGTDGYTLWGGYWQGAYYPSKMNGFMPAQTKKGQIDVPVFRMLGSDPLYQYSAGVGGDVQSVSTFEPVYANAQKPEWVQWYLNCQTDDPALGYTYFQAGQENSFTWEAFAKGYEEQLPQIAELQSEGKLKVQTLVETARAFRKKYPVTPVTACSAMSDYTDKQGRTLWFNSRFYRANLFWEGNRMGIRDIHLFDEMLESSYYRKTCAYNEFTYMTLPIVDGCLWSTPTDMACLRFYHIDGGETWELTGGEPYITQANGGMMIRWPLNEVDGEIILQLKEDRFIATCTNKSIEWCMLLYVHPEALLPSFTISDKTLTAVRGKYPYQLTLRSGVFEDLRNHRGLAYGILPKNGKVDMLMRSTNKNLERAKAQ